LSNILKCGIFGFYGGNAGREEAEGLIVIVGETIADKMVRQ
jgi:hypothetical protein